MASVVTRAPVGQTRYVFSGGPTVYIQERTLFPGGYGVAGRGLEVVAGGGGRAIYVVSGSNSASSKFSEKPWMLAPAGRPPLWVMNG